MKDILKGTLYPKEEKYLEIFMNPEKYYRDERLLCDLINEVLEDTTVLYNQLSGEQKAYVKNAYGKYDRKCYLQDIGELTNLKIFAPHLVVSNEEKLVKLIERYFYIKQLLGEPVTARKREDSKEDEIDDEDELEMPKVNDVIEAIDSFINSFTLERLLKKPIFFREKNDEIRIVDEILNIFSNQYKGIVFEDRYLLQNRRSDDTDVLETFQQKKLFYDKMTDLTSKEIIFNDANQQPIFNFQYLINNFFNKFISQYCINKKIDDRSSIIFLYKGGTTMKIIYEKYKQLYGDNDFFKKEVANFFSRSDSDYQIFINKVKFTNENNYTSIFYDMSILTYNILYYIKRFLNEYEKANEILPINLINESILEQKLKSLNSFLKTDIDTGKNELTLFKNVESFIGLTFVGKDYFSEVIPDGFRYTSIEDFSPKAKSWHEENEDDLDPVLFKRNKKYKYKIDLGGKSLNKKQQFIKFKKISPSRKDFFITSVKRYTIDGQKHYPKLVRLNNSNADNGIFMYVNETNTFLAYTKEIFSFNLFRIKLNAVVYYKTFDGKYGFINIPSELVDISICKANDYKTNIDNINFTSDFQMYSNTLNKNTLGFNSYSLIGFINDIYKALFTENQYPWDDPKYEKKINRVITLFLIYLNAKYTNTKEFITQFKTNIDNPSDAILNSYLFKRNPEQLLELRSDKELYKFITALIERLKSRDTLEPKHQSKVDDMKVIIKNLLDKFEIKEDFLSNADPIESVPYLEKYKTVENNSKYYKKYLKYKQKYNYLKNQ